MSEQPLWQRNNNLPGSLSLHDPSEPIKCSICLEQFSRRKRVPISLNCGHSFCALCLQGAVQTNKNGGGSRGNRARFSITCAFCRRITFEHPSKLRKNVMLTELLNERGDLVDSDEEVVVVSPTSSTVAARYNRLFWSPDLVKQGHASTDIGPPLFMHLCGGIGGIAPLDSYTCRRLERELSELDMRLEKLHKKHINRPFVLSPFVRLPSIGDPVVCVVPSAPSEATLNEIEQQEEDDQFLLERL